jgi:O-antigen/teichoic acid export membrane protein
VSRPGVVVAVWGGFLCATTALQALFSGTDRYTVLLLGGAAAGVLVLALVATLTGEARERRRPIPDLSVATAIAAAGVAAMVLGAELGTWLLLIGAGVAAGGLASLVRERRGER